MNEIFALHLNGELISPQARKRLWEKATTKYGESVRAGLYGWRPPKTFYAKRNHAKAAIAHLPVDIREDVEVVRYVPEKE